MVCTVLGGSGLAVTYFLYIHQELMSFFIPITGRQGSTGKPDIPIAVMATLPVTLLLPFQVCALALYKVGLVSHDGFVFQLILNIVCLKQKIHDTQHPAKVFKKAQKRT